MSLIKNGDEEIVSQTSLYFDSVVFRFRKVIFDHEKNPSEKSYWTG